MKIKFFILFLMFLNTQALGADFFYPGQSLDLLGTGIDIATKQVKGSCLIGPRTLSSNPEISFQTYISKNIDELTEAKTGHGGGGLNLGIIGASANLEFFMRTSEAQKRTSLIWAVDYDHGTVTLENRVLSALGRSAAVLTPVEKRAICGNYFVHGARLGARMYLAVTLQFDSEEEHKIFKKTVSVSFLFGLIKKRKTFIDEFKKYAAKAHISVSAEQLGGDDSSLKSIIGNSGSVYCNSGNIENCVKKADDLYNYAFGESGFRKQIQGASLEKLYPINFIVESYDESGHRELASDSVNMTVDSGLEEAAHSLILEKISLINQREILQMQGSFTSGSSEQVTRTRAQLEDIDRKISLINTKIEQYRRPDRGPVYRK